MKISIRFISGKYEVCGGDKQNQYKLKHLKWIHLEKLKGKKEVGRGKDRKNFKDNFKKMGIQF